ncbi:pyrokinin-1 receptor [Lutzomyia longipalpis]|uniref:pyrokinin-1 receptor n=1 Tax=Lutzomyia longipalpis TaxID=7200 RepID=UPI002483848D|nr:pyrokinin-1 receptor [Lutzomyia longipalpis]XP_055677779.1 pyrokinin-1 receptor [Lutzomyia longipalpis]XP_055677780.1 pyrokinin-1 receptor [Lutzomyia longipalpis]XP_055677781.1 pyrokinin-1 receptor [Lutzomyia longipalpis]
MRVSIETSFCEILYNDSNEMDENILHILFSENIRNGNITVSLAFKNLTTDGLGAYESDNETDYYQDVNLTDIFGPKRDPLYIVVPITVIYLLIFISGLVGNISTCIVISRNKSMHTATNYYLFSLAISDFLLLISGVPQEMYYIWSKYPYVFGEAFCVLRGLAAETSANATVLTITAFTVERYVAICHPFLSHTMSKLSRAVRLIVFIWLLSLALAIPQALQFGIVNHLGIDQCGFKRIIIKHSFELSTFLFFFAPMTLITVLYLLIGLKLRTSNMMKGDGGTQWNRRAHINSCRQQNHLGTRRVLKMLVAVVVAFFICWAPFHAQRLVAIYGTGPEQSLDPFMLKIYVIMTYISGVLYYLSTCINPLLYNIMSNKFREAFKETLAKVCRFRRQRHHTKRAYRILSRNQRRRFGAQESSEYSGNSLRDESVYSSSTQKQSIDSVTMSRGYSVNSHNNGTMILLGDEVSDTYLPPISLDILRKSNAEDYSPYRTVSKPPQTLPLCTHSYQQKTVINFHPRTKSPMNGQCSGNHSVSQQFAIRETPLNDDDFDRSDVVFFAADRKSAWRPKDKCYPCEATLPAEDLPPASNCNHIYYFYHKSPNDGLELSDGASDSQEKITEGMLRESGDNKELPSAEGSPKKFEVQPLETELDAYMKQVKLREKR